MARTEVRGGPGFDIVAEFSSDQCSPCPPLDVAARDSSADVISGGPGSDLVSAEGGNDVMDGGPGEDLAVHVSRFTSVSIDLAEGRAISTAGGVDELQGIEHAMGSVNMDQIRGDSKSNWLYGWLGEDLIDGAEGADNLYVDFTGDILIGGTDESLDTVSVIINEAASIDLASGTASPREASPFSVPEFIVDFENAVGGAYDDVIVGDDGSNILEGAYGSDEISGGTGNDKVFGEYEETPQVYFFGDAPGNDVLDGGEGRDLLDGGPLVDECRNGEVYVSCEEGDRSKRMPGVGASFSTGVPWWWERIDIDYLHANDAVERLLASLR